MRAVLVQRNPTGGRAGFWRRLAALWIDLFVLHAAATAIITGADTAGIRIALEPLVVILGAVYGGVFLCSGHTLGKILMGFALRTAAGRRPGAARTLVREALGKWGMLAAFPPLAGRFVLARIWVPTLYDALAVLPLLIVTFLHYLIARRTWYDQLAGTEPIRTSPDRKFVRLALVALVLLTLLGPGGRVMEYAGHRWLQCRLLLYRSMRAVDPFVEFLRSDHATPVDYVMGLFDRHDVVVLCERPHPEMTQWDFIYDLVSDPRFIARVGRVFTEYGPLSLQTYLDRLMATRGLTKDELHDRVVHIMRNWAIWPNWTNTNFYTYLTRLYALNQSLPAGRRVRHHLTDMPVDWSSLRTPEDYQAYRESLGLRDHAMAWVVILEMERLERGTGKPPKCLVIQNYRHAFDLTGGDPRARRSNTYEHVKDVLGPRAANVLLNTNIFLAVPIAGGLWDAAFAEAGHPRIGFDLAGSPFGEEAFDLFPFRPELRGRLRYSDVFTGLVYAHPLSEQYISQGIPGYYKGFEAEALRRSALVSPECVLAATVGIEQERQGGVPLTKKLPGHTIETIIELVQLGGTGAGLAIAAVAILVRWRRVAETSLP